MADLSIYDPIGCSHIGRFTYVNEPVNRTVYCYYKVKLLGAVLQNDAQGSLLESLKSVRLCRGQVVMPYYTTIFNE